MANKDTTLAEQKENIRREAILEYGLYIMSFTTNKSGNFHKFDAAQKCAFKLGLMAGNDGEKPFSGINELHQWFIMGKNTAAQKATQAQEMTEC